MHVFALDHQRPTDRWKGQWTDKASCRVVCPQKNTLASNTVEILVIKKCRFLSYTVDIFTVLIIHFAQCNCMQDWAYQQWHTFTQRECLWLVNQSRFRKQVCFCTMQLYARFHSVEIKPINKYTLSRGATVYKISLSVSHFQSISWDWAYQPGIQIVERRQAAPLGNVWNLFDVLL